MYFLAITHCSFHSAHAFLVFYLLGKSEKPSKSMFLYIQISGKNNVMSAHLLLLGSLLGMLEANVLNLFFLNQNLPASLITSL